MQWKIDLILVILSIKLLCMVIEIYHLSIDGFRVFESAALKASLDYLNSVTVRCFSGLYGAVNFSGNWTGGHYRSWCLKLLELYIFTYWDDHNI